MNRTQIYLPKKQLELLRGEAARRRITVSEIIRTTIKERFENKAKITEKSPRETLVAFAKRIGKMGERAPRDLASNMDEYLYGGKR